MKILMISNHLGVQSGVQRYVQNLLLNLDLTRYQVDLFVGLCPPDQASCAPALEAAGVHIIAVPDNKKVRIRALYQHLKTHKDYDIIHYHTASKIGAPVCGMMRVLCPHAKIIVHSHIVYPPMTLTWRAAHLVYQLFADYFLGCGVAAGRFVFGDHIDRRPNFSVACNAVDQTRFYPNAAARTAIRAQYGITGTERLAGFVGRLNHQKNPLYLIRVFVAMVQQDPRWKLLLVGGGEQEQPMRELAAQLGVADRVLCPHAKIIVHSHIVYPPMTLTWRAAHLVYQLFADYFLGCGVAAGRFVFGDHIDRRPNFSVACNAVDQTRFYPNAAARTAIRAQYGITGTERLAGFVGRLNHQKNPLYLIRVFVAMVQQDPRWKLLLVGGGEQEQPMRELAAQLGVADRVLFAGVQNNVPDYMNAFDLFLLPSNFEGSPVTLVEAQGCGVPCLASTNVPGDGSVTELVHFLPLSAPFEEWAKTADSIAPGGPHADYWPTLAAAGYELKTAAHRMEQVYDKVAGEGAR